MNKQEVIRLLRLKVYEYGSQAAVEEAMHVAPGYVSLLLSGRRNPSPTMLDFLGLKKKIDYVRKDE